jgi:hypothetical protein
MVVMTAPKIYALLDVAMVSANVENVFATQDGKVNHANNQRHAKERKVMYLVLVMVNANMANVFAILVLKAKAVRRKVCALKIAPNMVSAGKASVNVTQGGVVMHVNNSTIKRIAQKAALVKMVSVTMDVVSVPHNILDQVVNTKRNAQMTAVDMVNVT